MQDIPRNFVVAMMVYFLFTRLFPPGVIGRVIAYRRQRKRDAHAYSVFEERMPYQGTGTFVRKKRAQQARAKQMYRSWNRYTKMRESARVRL